MWEATLQITGKWLDCKSMSSQGVEKTSAKQEDGKFWGPPVKEAGTWIIIGQRSHEVRRYKKLDRTKRRAERRASREEYNIVANSIFVFCIVYNKLRFERHSCFRHSISQHALPQEACKTAFFAIPDYFINKLYESLPNRMDAVLQAHGSHTRY